jgi:signal transduction histidine kinase/ActR/RegA family two-component response regulator
MAKMVARLQQLFRGRDVYKDLHQAKRQVEHLHRVALALTNELSLEKMAELVATECRAALGADAICVYLLRQTNLEMVAEFGCTEEFKTKWAHLPLDIISKMQPVNQKEPLFFGSADEFKSRLPSAKGLVDRSGRETIAYVPLAANSTPIGFLGFSYNRKQPCPTETAFIITLVNLCAQALERVRLFDQERQARQMAEAANTAKTDFLANISHEIRTPIGVIQGFADLLSDSHGLNSEQKQWTSVIRRNTRQLTEIIGEVLDISKIETGEIEVENIVISLNELLEDVASTTAVRAKEKGLRLEFSGLETPTYIYSDPTRLRQILLNLVGNAIKFTTCGSVEVQVHCAQPKRLEVIVKDTGIGIPVLFHPSIFKPFTQADTSTCRKFGGTGLGLYISKRLASALGGNLILLESTPGLGSTFLFTLNCEGTARQTPCEPIKRGATIVEKEDELKGLNILLVDDSEDNLDLLSHMLTLKGANVEVAGSGMMAIEMAFAKYYDVIVMDIQMPELDGYQTVSLLRQQGYRRPITALTAHALRSEREKSLRMGFDDYLTKPINLSTVVRTLKYLGGRVAPSSETFDLGDGQNHGIAIAEPR